MYLRQQLIQERIEKTAKDLGVSEDLAFLRFAHSIITGCSIHAFNQSDLIEGAQEKQIDAITIEQDEDEAIIYIIQTKNTTSFSSNALILLRNGLDWVFNKSIADVNQLSNKKFRDKILEYRDLQAELGPSNMQVIVAFVTNGLTNALSDEFNQETKTIQDKYDNNTFSKFDVLICGADELIERLNVIEKADRRTNADIRIIYDANNPSLIRYYAPGLKGVVCSATAQEIARIVNSNPKGTIFDLNVRRFLGIRGAVNSDILKTCKDSEISRLFWFLNNGITIVCDKVDPVTDPDNPVVKVENMQIVNGCQTATVLALAESKEELARDARVLLRIYETMDPKLVDKIVLTTNNQNKISDRNLRANDPVQLDMERAFAKYNYLYERKPRQYDNQKDIDAKRIAVNEIVAQSYLAIVLKKPSDARRRKYKVWGQLYDQIFSGSQTAEPYIISYLIYRMTDEWLKSSSYIDDSDDIIRKLANNGSFHVARIASYIWRNGDNWNNESSHLQDEIGSLEANPSILFPKLNESLNILGEVIKNKPSFESSIDTALKSGALDGEIDRSLHLKIKRKVG